MTILNRMRAAFALIGATAPMTLKAEGIVGRSMLAEEALELKLGDCNKIMAAWTEQFIEPLKKLNAFVDQGALCMGNRAGSQFSFVINAEPVDEGDVEAFDKEIEHLNEHQVHGIRANFKRVSNLTDLRKVTVSYRGKPRPVLVHEFEEPLKNFYSQFLELADENRIFRKRNPSEFWARLTSFVPSEFVSKLQPMLKDPIEITSWHSWRGQFDSGSVVTSGMNTGNYRFCADSSTPCEVSALDPMPKVNQGSRPNLQRRTIWLGQKELFSGNVNAIKPFGPKEL
jgi:hypothetical protein